MFVCQVTLLIRDYFVLSLITIVFKESKGFTYISLCNMININHSILRVRFSSRVILNKVLVLLSFIFFGPRKIEIEVLKKYALKIRAVKSCYFRCHGSSACSRSKLHSLTISYFLVRKCCICLL